MNSWDLGNTYLFIYLFIYCESRRNPQAGFSIASSIHTMSICWVIHSIKCDCTCKHCKTHYDKMTAHEHLEG